MTYLLVIINDLPAVSILIYLATSVLISVYVRYQIAAVIYSLYHTDQYTVMSHSFLPLLN
jgi:hypothetical protein